MTELQHSPLGDRATLMSAMGPEAVDQCIRQAVSLCWMILPPEKKTFAAVDREIQRLVARALANLKEDISAFEFESVKPPG